MTEDFPRRTRINTKAMTEDIIYKTEVYEIIGAAIQVHKELGHGFLEAVYQEALPFIIFRASS